MKFVVKTLGCKANLTDSQMIEAELLGRGWRAAAETDGRTESDVDLCIVNSCTVTDEADRQSRKMASRLGRDYPNAKIVITGCSAEVDPERLKNSKGIHYVVGNRDKPKLVDLVLNTPQQRAKAEVLGEATGYTEMLSRHPMDREWPMPSSDALPDPEEGASARTRAFIKIQDGCNSFCTYCVIPYGRGPSRSLKIEEVVQQVKGLVLAGYREAVITGINIGDYGMDWSGSLQIEALVRAILKETHLERIRISSLDPTEITPGLLALMEEERRLCPHFHVSLQSPHSKILRLMKRKYAWEQVEQKLGQIEKLGRRLKEKGVPGGVFVGMDLITGFPGETEEDFEATVQLLKGLYWSRLHVFPYSERAGTPATRLPGKVSPEEKARRAAILRQLSFERLQAHMGTPDSKTWVSGVLLEGLVRGPDGSKNWLSGYSPSYQRFLVPARADWSNRVVNLRPERIYSDAGSGDVSYVSEIQ
ncbi:MAG: tRNA (N(6)-L-threonylcarbamoyladenosine(37)-C(2))-methylthiotransferase MtaB [Bdellovibrionales bacterium]|nr:tRNA (N(6)-L-threonylcarbamoyladenosine(37)-C(2))-methylthiotransferase MtaB [Bdellovibrionales bacterium]